MRITVASLLTTLLIAAAPATAGAASPQFTDWVGSTPTSASGTLLGHPVSLTGNRIHTAVTDGTFQGFNTPDFTPQLANSDMVEFGGFTDYAYRLDLGAATQDPVLELFSLGSTLTFPAGTQLVKLSGQPGFSVSGNTVGAASGDVNGTVRVVGVFSVLSFSTTINYVGPEDGIDLQVGGTTPSNTPPPAACPACDSDHDGVTDGLDCDDLNGSVHQGAHDVPGNGIDEDCSGADARLPKLQRNYHLDYDRGRRRVRFTELVVKRARAGDVLRLSCRGRGCPRRERIVIVKHKTRRVEVLTRRFRHAWLRRGAVVTLRIEHPATRARTIRWKVIGPKLRQSDHWDP